MQVVKVKINKSTYTLSFGISCLRLLGKLWNAKTINEVLNRISVLDSIDPENPSFEFIDVIESIFIAAIRNNEENTIDEKDFVKLDDWIFANPEKLTEVITALIESMPKPKTEKKPNPATRKK